MTNTARKITEPITGPRILTSLAQMPPIAKLSVGLVAIIAMILHSYVLVLMGVIVQAACTIKIAFWSFAFKQKLSITKRVIRIVIALAVLTLVNIVGNIAVTGLIGMTMYGLSIITIAIWAFNKPLPKVMKRIWERIICLFNYSSLNKTEILVKA